MCVGGGGGGGDCVGGGGTITRTIKAVFDLYGPSTTSKEPILPIKTLLPITKNQDPLSPIRTLYYL